MVPSNTPLHNPDVFHTPFLIKISIYVIKCNNQISRRYMSPRFIPPLYGSRAEESKNGNGNSTPSTAKNWKQNLSCSHSSLATLNLVDNFLNRCHMLEQVTQKIGSWDLGRPQIFKSVTKTFKNGLKKGRVDRIRIHNTLKLAYFPIIVIMVTIFQYNIVFSLFFHDLFF